MATAVAGPEIERLIQLLARLPGLGPRSARRAALHLIKKREALMTPLTSALQVAIDKIQVCKVCGNIDTQNPCTVCTDPRRDQSIIVVVADVADLWALERSAARTLMNDLSRKLEQWTGRRWTVIVSNEAGQPTLRSQNEVMKNQRERAAESDPRVKEVLARFPGAKVVEVRRLAPEPPESDASIEDPAESADSDDL